MKLPSRIIARIEEQAAEEFPQLHPFLAYLQDVGYFTHTQWCEMCKVRSDSVIKHGIPRHETNLFICLFILEEQGV